MTPLNRSQPTVLVVGGGYAGIAVARGLDDVADVTLVEPKDAFTYNVAALRALVDPSWLSKIFMPYDRLLTRGRVVRDRVTRLEGTRAYLASGSVIAADFVVLATGSSYPFPAKSDRDESHQAQERYRTAHDALAAAERVLILGAGAVGLELAGEIRATWPEKRITMTDIAEDILPGPYRADLRAELRRQVEELDIELILGSPLEAAPPSQPGAFQPVTVMTQGGSSMSAEIWFRAYGIAPITDYLGGDLMSLRTREGYVEVTPTMQLPGHERIYAVGDIAAGHPNGAGRAGRHGDLVAANIRALVTGEGEIRTVEITLPAIILPLGPEGGASQRPNQDALLGPSEVAAIKGRDMMVDRYAEKLGVLQRVAETS